jgi:CDP-2,3-bis-(O-geranylgeranyl)-sn-glycerol synthase
VAAFFKRRMGLQRGAPLFIIDQLDFVLGAWLMSLLIAPDWFMQHFTFAIILVVLIITPILHRVTNIIGYRMGAKREPW